MKCLKTHKRVFLTQKRCLETYIISLALEQLTLKGWLIGQVELAKQRSARRSLENVAYFGTIFFESKWVEDNIGNRKRKPSKASSRHGQVDSSMPALASGEL